MRILSADLLERKEIVNPKGVNVLVNGKSRSGKTKLSNEIYNYYLNREDYNPVLLNALSLEGFFGMSSMDSYTTCKIPTHSGQHISITKGDDKRSFSIFPRKYKGLFVGNKYLVKGRTLGLSNNVLIIDDIHHINTDTLLCLTEFLSAIYDSIPLLICIGNGRVYNGTDNLFTSILYNKFPIKLKRFELIPWETSIFDKRHPKLEENYLKSFDVLPETQINLLSSDTYSFIKKRSRKINYNAGTCLPSGLVRQYALPVPVINQNQYLYVSNSYEDTDSINQTFINESGLPVYIERPNTSCFSESEIRLIDSQCKRKLRTIELIIGCPVTFKNNNQSMYGVIVSIEKSVSSKEEINSVSIVCKNQTYRVTKKEFKIKDSNKSFSYLPIELAWCVKLSLFNDKKFDCDNALVLNKDMRMHVFEEYSNKTSAPNFVNTYFINQRNFLVPNYVEYMSTSS